MDGKKLLVSIDSIEPWSQNPREISEKDFRSLKQKIQRWGLWKPFLVWESKGRIIGGNQRYKACKELGMSELWVEYREPKDEAEALEMAIADNESSGEWVKSMLIEQIKLNAEKINLEDYKISIKDSSLRDLMPIDTEEDEPPSEEDINTVSVLGDLYELNDHRVLCGDSTSKEQVGKLMNGKKADMVFTDPPYGMNYEPNHSSKREGNYNGAGYHNVKTQNKIIGDNNDFDPSFFIEYFKDVKEQFWWGADYYYKRIFNAEYGIFLVWNKRYSIEDINFNTSHYELCWSKQQHLKEVINIKWFGIQGTEKQDIRNRVHPTQKPIQLPIWFINKYGKESHIIVDLFLGSGSTLIACEKTERICYGMELDEHYCDVIVARYIKYMQDEGKKFTIKRNGELIQPSLFLKEV